MDIYWNIFTMHGPMNVKFPNNTSKWQLEFNSAFKGLMCSIYVVTIRQHTKIHYVLMTVIMSEQIACVIVNVMMV
jgi:hypothetical protein